jgi:isopentenyl-diphosphate delta-isomerase
MPAGERVDLVNEKDEVVGTTTVGECLTKGLLHRAVAVLVIRSSGKFLLQRRSKNDRWHPGLWTISSTGHVKEGEAYDAAARREVREELGLSPRLKKVGKYLLPPLRSEGLTEREWVTFYVTKTDSECTIDPVELDSVKEFDGRSLRSLLTGRTVTPDAVIILRDYLSQPGKGA